eukprot:c39438_g1_i1.p1 GENE.c39438_g1_i1~~c39438_g1_i1.p1  ORF type:complete len:148 (+),score=15.15 c39438_g1_i1:59-445(+)
MCDDEGNLFERTVEKQNPEIRSPKEPSFQKIPKVGQGRGRGEKRAGGPRKLLDNTLGSKFKSSAFDYTLASKKFQFLRENRFLRKRNLQFDTSAVWDFISLLRVHLLFEVWNFLPPHVMREISLFRPH